MTRRVIFFKAQWNMQKSLMMPLLFAVVKTAQKTFAAEAERIQVGLLGYP